MTNIHEAKTHLSRLVERAAAGEEIVIAKAGKPLAKLVPYVPVVAPRKGGFLAGQIKETADAWEPERDFASGPLFPPPDFPQESFRVAEEEVEYRAGPQQTS